MNIAFISETCYPYTKGGVETRYYTLGRYLIGRGHKVTWFTAKQWEGPMEQDFDGLRLIGLSPNYELYEDGKRRISQALFFGLSAFKLLFWRDHFDILDISQYPFFHCFPAKLYAFLTKTPSLVSWYEFWGDHWYTYSGRGLVGRTGKLIEKTVARLAGYIISVSEQSRNGLIASGIPAELVSHVPLAVDFDRLFRINPGKDQCDIIYFGRLKGHKNIDKLIHAINICREKDIILKVKILGDGPERQNLEALINELNLNEQVRLLGRIDSYDELMAEVKTGRLFVHPSTKEGGGSTTLIEANACGLPVIAVRHPLGFDNCLIEENHNGFWSPDESPEQLAQTIQKFFFLSDQEKDKMVENARRTGENYNFKIIYRRIEEIYVKRSASKIS